ncbi:uncharacterized protein PV09_06940 [Verruconis gallopava]|uniref:UBX domain-containing protein n=1 Tax=Verruconis gallopava TaxID=253628 RepID=A0A0D2A4Q8_9PEZI|nr:uncharacterized protein PV09_06940 [Verruconis gallopava]KIW01768.1 hypothetical protein PV09_06940 [Verruconis gallopava]
MDDDVISTFTSLTGSTPAQATQYLQLTEGNLEQAAQLWFETSGSLVTDSAAGTATSQAPPTLRPSTISQRGAGYREDDDGVIHIDSDEDEMDFDNESSAPHRQQPNTEDDEAIARRLQEEMYGSASRDTETVRAPISRTTETLVGPESMMYGGVYGGGDDEDVEAMIAQQMAARQARQAARSRPGIFNQRDTQSAVWDSDPEQRARNLAYATGGQSTQSSRAQSLAEIYRPPFEIISRLSWDQARSEGRQEKKWLLVNVQDPSIFDCQMLNRDLWKDERVAAVIRESFVFLQYLRTDPRSDGYIQYYFAHSVDNPDAYPHIAIVDPRTGEQMKIWSGRPVPKADDFVEALYNFLDRYSLDVAKKNPVAKRKAEQPKVFDIDRMTEDEMLQMAMQQSLANGGSGTPPKQEDPDDLTKSVELGSAEAGPSKNDSSGTSVATPSAAVDEDASQPSAESLMFAQIASDRPHEEPPADPKTTTRIQFRHPGGRVVRRFTLTDSVRRIYEWLKASPPSPEQAGKTFDLMFMGKNLLESLDESIEEAGLKNASVNIEWIDE